MEKQISSPTDTYEFICEIGNGRFGTAYKIISKKYQTFFCLKKTSIFQENGTNPNFYLKESEILRLVCHRNVIKFYEYFKKDDFFYLILEYCPNGTLQNIISNNLLTIGDFRLYFKQILEAIDSFHSINIIHRDIKPSNIGFDSFLRPKIIDWGLSEKMNSEFELETLYVGSFPFFAPEIFKKIPYDGKKADIWSLGITMFVSFFNSFPWGNGPQNEQLTNLLNGIILFPQDSDLEIKRIILKICKINPFERPSAKELLNDSFFNFLTISRSKSHFNNLFLDQNLLPKNNNILIIKKRKRKISNIYNNNFTFKNV